MKPIYRDLLNYYLWWRFLDIYKNNENIPSFVFAPLALYFTLSKDERARRTIDEGVGGQVTKRAI